MGYQAYLRVAGAQLGFFLRRGQIIPIASTSNAIDFFVEQHELLNSADVADELGTCQVL